MWSFGANGVTERRQAASVSRRQRYLVLSTVSDKNVSSRKYVVENISEVVFIAN